jgi:hypothetical protein
LGRANPLTPPSKNVGLGRAKTLSSYAVERNATAWAAMTVMHARALRPDKLADPGTFARLAIDVDVMAQLVLTLLGFHSLQCQCSGDVCHAASVSVN